MNTNAVSARTRHPEEIAQAFIAWVSPAQIAEERFAQLLPANGTQTIYEKEKTMKHQKRKAMKQTFAIPLRKNELTAADLLSMARTLDPGVDDPGECEGPYPNAVNAAKVVLMSAALLGTTNTVRLEQFTGYSRTFISAIKFNMENNHLWSDGRYDASAWLSAKVAIDDDLLSEDVEVAMGWAWTPEADSDDAIDPWSSVGRNAVRK